MKKFICVLLGIALCLGCFSAFSACGGGKKKMGDAVYPEDPQFNALNGFGVNNVNTHEANSHDPVVIEADGKYYSFNTDNYNEYGYSAKAKISSTGTISASPSRASARARRTYAPSVKRAPVHCRKCTTSSLRTIVGTNAGRCGRPK